jgi:heme-degrading monooxygenase HmoA
MYVRLLRFALAPDKEAVATALARDLVPEISRQPGCRAVSCFGDAESGQYGLYVLWNSQEEANAAANVIRPKLDQHLSGHALRPPEAGLFRVIESA